MNNDLIARVQRLLVARNWAAVSATTCRPRYAEFFAYKRQIRRQLRIAIKDLRWARRTFG